MLCSFLDGTEDIRMKNLSALYKSRRGRILFQGDFYSI